MKHPILEGTGYRYYILILAIISIAHTFIFYFYFEFGLLVSIVDSLVHNLFFSALALGLWYIVRFAGNDQNDFISILSTHFFAALFILLFWSALSEFFMKFLFGNDIKYFDFLENTGIWRLVIGAMFYSMAVLAFYLIQYYVYLQEKLVMELELKSLLNESELKMLKSQINPHFMFNSLNSISALTLSMPEQAHEMVIKLSNFLRYSIGKDSKELNTLSEEIGNAQLYMDIEKVRFGEKLLFLTEVDEKCLELLVPNLILQPLFENAIKYGVYESLTPVTVKLSCTQEDRKLLITIFNDFDPDAIPAKGEGIGLAHIRKRLLLVYGQNDLMEIEKTENTFKVTLKIPNQAYGED